MERVEHLELLEALDHLVPRAAGVDLDHRVDLDLLDNLVHLDLLDLVVL